MVDKKDYLEILKSITRDDVEKAFENLFQNNSIKYKSHDTGTENSIIYENSRFALIRIFEQICIDKFGEYDMSKSNQNNVNYLDISNVFKNLGYEILPSIDSKECLKILKEEYKKYLDEKYPQGYDQTYFSDPFYLSRDKNQDKCKDDGIYFWKLFENEQNLNKYFDFLKKEYPNPNTHNAFKSKTNILNRFFVEKYGDYFNWLKSFGISSNSIEEYIKKYSLFKKTKDYDEQYKFDYAQKNKGIFNELSNLESKIKSLGNPNFNSYFIGRCSGLKHLMENHLEDLNKALTILFSDEDLETRIISFKNILNDKLINDSNWHNNKTLVEVQTASYFLFTNDYEKNLLFTKMKPYEKFAKKFNLQNLLNYASEEERYITWQKYCEIELLPIMDKVLNKRHTLLDAQDFIWFIGNNTEVDREEKTQEDKNMTVNIPLNQILYGPPGTGKTYSVRKYINEILGKNPGLNIQNEEQKINSVIETSNWYTAIALAMYQEGKENKYKVSDLLLNKIIVAFAQTKESKNIKAKLWGELQTHTPTESNTVNYGNRRAPFIFNKTENSEWYLTNEGIEYVEENLSEQLEQLNAKDNIRKIDDFYKFLTFHQSYSYEEFMEGIKPQINNNEDSSTLSYEYNKGIFKEICQQANSDPDNNYLLIIDEINRGNISKIFGELITLIETDKRVNPNGERIFDNTITEKEQLLVVLPYTKNKFGVPKNLYILGTMNTSDRSIASVDIALRRRFVFKEMMPDSKLVSDFGCNFKRCFEVLNERISILLDRDHQIGHSYFIDEKYANSDINTLENIWFDSIIPLLNEYFYGDWEKLQAILGEAKDDNTSFIKVKKVNKDSFAAKVDFCDDKSFDFNYNCNFASAMEKAFGNNFNGVTND